MERPRRFKSALLTDVVSWTFQGLDQSNGSSQKVTLASELSIFPAFTPDPIRLAELRGSATYSPPVSPTAADARELFASIGDGQTFFELFETRGLTLTPKAATLDGRIDVLRCVDGRRKTLLHQACRCGNVQVAKCLLFHGASASARCREGRTPFHDAAAISSGKMAVELLKLLYEHDPKGISIVDVNGSHVLHLAAIHGNLEVIQWCAGLLAQPAGKRAAIRSPRSLISRYVMHMGITSFSGRNMLHYAAYNGQLDVIKWLLDRENARRGELTVSAIDTNGYTVLHYAAMGASLEVCEWLVLEAPERHQLNLTARTNEGKSAEELASARPAPIRNFLFEISRVPSVPSELRCLGADTTSLGVAWSVEPTSTDSRLWEMLKPLYFHLEICKKPPGLSHASGFLTMLMLMPPASPASPRAPPSVSSALMSASYLLQWKPLGVLLQPEAREHWVCGLERDTEYLVRMRARNRNGFSGYSLPNLSGVFTTSDGGRRRSISSLQRFFGAMKMDPPMEAISTSFIGDLHFELLEARHLPRAKVASMTAMPMSPSSTKNISKAVQGRYYGVITIETPSTPDAERGDNFCRTRLIYCVRSPLATLQQDLVLSGSSQAWRHPRFGLISVFRTPESLAHTQVTIAVRHETQGQADSCCVGRLSLSMLDLVQGMPAKMQWLPLVNMNSPETEGGLVLLRTLFLPDGISELPHPTIPELWGSTAEKLLSTPQALASEKDCDFHSPPGSSSSTTSTSSSSSRSSQFSHPSMLIDRLGFRVFDPEMQFRNGEWQRKKGPSGATRSYAYYKLLIEALERQEEVRWRDRGSKLFRNHANSTISDYRAATGQVPKEQESSNARIGVSSCVLDASERRDLGDVIWRGIPMSRRPSLYSQLSGASSIRDRYPDNYFLSLTKRLEDPMDEVHSRPKRSRFTVAKKQIQVDLKRTFAGNDECWLTSDVGQKSLERVLLTYALHNDTLGYCQSMTFVVGRLLCLCRAQMQDATDLPIEEEERVFWLLHVICEDFFPAYYTQGMTGLQVDGGVLERLLKSRLPKVFRHFQQLHAPPMGLVLMTQWMLPLCCAVFPSETTFRFLDVLFLEGSLVVFAVAIALLRISQHELIAENVDYTQLFRFLRARDQRLHDTPLLMEVAYEEHQLISSQIGSLRQTVAQELGVNQSKDIAKAVKTTKLLSVPVDELRPGDNITI